MHICFVAGEISQLSSLCWTKAGWNHTCSLSWNKSPCINNLTQAVSMSPSDRSQEKICYWTYTGVTNYRKNMNHDPDSAGIGGLCYSLSGMLLSCFGSTSPSEGSLQVNTKLLWVISFLTSDEMNGLFEDDNTPIHRAREVTEGFDECDWFMWIVPFGFHTRRVQHSWMGYQSQIVDWHLKLSFLPTTLSFMNFGAK